MKLDFECSNCLTVGKAQATLLDKNDSYYLFKVVCPACEIPVKVRRNRKRVSAH